MTGESNGYHKSDPSRSSLGMHSTTPIPCGRGSGDKKDTSNDITWNTIRNSTVPATIVSAFPSFGSCLRVSLGVTVALYILNQKHLLPKPLSSLVSRVLFWPTLPITVSRRLGNWYTVIDETVIMGGAPFGFAKIPEKLYEQYGVEGVINLCEEYRGPDRTYRKLGIRHLHLPTTDHFEPSLEHLKTAVHFIAEHEASGKKVYVHCRAGHGRSAAVVFAWLLSKNPKIDLEQLNLDFCQIRNVRKTLYKQRNILRFHTLLQNQKGDIDNDDETQLFSDESEGEL